MIRLTIYRIGETLEVDLPLEDTTSLRSNKIHVFGRINPKTGIREDIRYRPYYRRTIDGILNIYAEEDISNGN